MISTPPTPAALFSFQETVVSAVLDAPFVRVDSTNALTFVVTSSTKTIALCSGEQRTTTHDLELQSEIRRGIREGLEPLREVTASVTKLMTALSQTAARMKRGNLHGNAK